MKAKFWAAVLLAIIFITNTGLAQPPRWGEIPEEIFADECDTIRIETQIFDPENREWAFSYSGDNLPARRISLISPDHRQVRFVWLSNFDDAGIYRVVLHASDGENVMELETSIEIFNNNRPPFCFPLGIMDVRLIEDSNLNELQIARLNRIFSDPDRDTLVFSLINPPPALRLRIDQRNTSLYRRLPHDFFTLDPLCVIVKAEDAEFATYDTFFVTVDPMPDTLRPFHLISPEDTTHSPATDFIPFLWTQAVNVDLDRTEYQLFIARADVDTISMASFIDTTLEVPSAVLWRWGGEVRWWVWGYAGPDSTRSYETFTLFPPLGTEDDLPLPQEFSLSAFPNPFNSTTTISFQSPHAIAGGVGGVSLRIYDISGRLVVDLTAADPPRSAGEHKVTWDASSVGAGVYFVRLEAGDKIATQKILFLH